MVSKTQFQLVRSLRQKKSRKELGLFVAETPKVVRDLITAGIKLHSLFCISNQMAHWEISGLSHVLTPINQSELERLSVLESPNELVAIFEIPQQTPFNQPNLLIALDGINDPGNLGTIVRTSDWFGFHHFILSPDTADLYNAKCVQASMGSIGRAKFLISDAKSFINTCSPQTRIFGAFLDGVTLSAIKPESPSILVIGSEAHGIRNDWEQNITHRIHIPAGAPDTNTPGRAESLNAASAAAIILHHFNIHQ